uniref:CCHC-type domain-containing protein n=1 Tax=Tanacetum cinerariifolium TaxID=118510 RepID=A0A6L2P5G0_TANCI|nr:hypothetical protein [Tanacetum cinerariifolium]
MEFESAQNNTTAKLPILKLGEYEMWLIRIKQYFKVQDYALWEVIENRNSWVSVPQTTQKNGVSVTKMSIPVTAEEKTNKKKDVKARSLLLIALPNENQLTFSQYNDAKTMFVAIETRFRGNEATKKTHKTLLKQQYENFNASSIESLDSIFNRLQKIVSRLAILVWMNKADIETLSIDDLYNNFKIIEQDVKKSVGASTASTVSPNVNTTSSQVSTANFSDNAVYAFMIENLNGSNLLQHDLKQIHEDDLEAMDLRWQLFLLSMRAKRDSKLESNIIHDLKSDDSKENSDDSFIKEQVSEVTSSFVESSLNVDKKTAFSIDKKIEFVKSKNHDKPVRKSVRHMTGNIAYLLDFKEFNRGYATFGGGAHGGRISGKDLFGPTFVSSLMHKKYCLVITDEYSREKGIKREYSVAKTSQQNRVAERRNMTLIEAARTMVLIVKPHNKSPYELCRGFKPALSFMRPFRCHVTILNTLDNLGKFDGKSDEGFFVGYSLSSKAFRVYNTRTRKNKSMIEGNGPKWLFDIDSLTQSMNYVPVVAGIILDESAGTQGDLNTGTSSGKEVTSQDYIVMPIWKYAFYFDPPSKDVGNDEPKFDFDDNEDDDKDKFEDDSSPKEVNAARKHVTTASLEVNTGRFELNTVDPSLNTNSSSNPHSPTDMFKLRASDTLKATHVKFFSDRDAPEVDLGTIPNSYGVLTTSHTRIHKDNPIKNVIGEIEPTSVAKDLFDSSWVEAMQKELLQFKLQQVYVDAIIFRITSNKKEDGIFISHDKYIDEIFKKFNYTDVMSASTLVDLKKPLVKDGDANDVDVHLYRSMIGSLMYLTASRPNIMFAVCACARFQVTPKTSHLLAVKRIFRYLKGKPTLGLWYSRDSPFELVAYTDSDYTRATQDRKSTTEVGDEAVHKELSDRMERAATNASSFEAKQDDGSGPGCQDTILRDVKAQTRQSEKFWQTASSSTYENGEIEITATIDGRVKSVTEASIRRHPKLEDSEGISSLPNTKSFEQLALMVYVSNSNRLTFQKGHFSPQWRFLIYTILHCLSPKKTAWEQFSSNIATTNMTFNFSKMIFKGMLKNLDNKYKFLMYPRFIQILLNKHKRLLKPHKSTYVAPTLTQKIFSNMRRASKGYSRVDIPLFPTMLVQGPILQGDLTISQPPISAPSRVPTPPHDSPLPEGHTPGSEDGRMTLNELTVRCTTLSKKVESIVSDSTVPKLQTVEDLQRDALLHYDAKFKVMNLILLSIPNDIYNSVDACTSAKDIWKRVELDTFDDLFDYLQQFEKLVNTSRAKKLKKSHDPLPLVAHRGSSSRNTSSYYVTHPTSMVDYNDEYQQDDIQTNSEVPLTSAMNSGNHRRKNRRAYVQKEVVEGSNETGNVQRTLRNSSSGNTSTVQCYKCSGKGHYARNCPKPRVRDSKYFMEQIMEEIKDLSANICLMARIQPTNHSSDVRPSYDSTFVSEVQSSFINENEEQMYPTHTKIINSTIGDDQIDSNIIFDTRNGNVNSGSVEKDTHVSDLYALEQLARNAYQEAEKQQIFAQKVQKQNKTFTSQLELYKERVRVLENINNDNNYLNEFLEADQRAKHFDQQARSQFIRDRDIIRDLEKQQDKLELVVNDYKWKNEEFQKTHLILKREICDKEDSYHDTIIDLEAKLKKNVDLILKLGNSLQGMFMLGPTPLSVYDQQLKHGLWYSNPYTLKKAISQCPKLYLALSLGNLEISLNVSVTTRVLRHVRRS